MSKYELTNEQTFEAVREESRTIYKKIRHIYCPYFKDKIIFNSKGWEHLRFKSHGHSRSRKEQYVRFKLLPFVSEVISNSRTLQGICHTSTFEIISTNSKWNRVLKPVTFWEFVAVISDVRIRVVVKQIEDGDRYFFSVIPYWKIKAGTNQRLLYGHPKDRY